MKKLASILLISYLLIGGAATGHGREVNQLAQVSQVEFLNGTWEGTYTCGQGLTKLRLEISAQSSNDIDAVFNFSAHPSNPSVPSGSFRMKGTYTAFNSPNVPTLLNLKGTNWIEQPPGWITVDLRGNVFVSEGKISGDVTTPGCSKFELISQNAGKTVDPRSEAIITKLNPQVQPYAREFVRKAALKGIQIKIISGLRTYKEQDVLYCQGRDIPYCNGLYKPGKIVTKAKGGHSNHNFGIAFDIGIFDGNKYLSESPKYDEVGEIGKELGLEWGGDWKTIKDRPHFQLRPQWATSLSESEMLEELRRRTENNEPFYP